MKTTEAARALIDLETKLVAEIAETDSVILDGIAEALHHLAVNLENVVEARSKAFGAALECSGIVN